MSLTFAMMLSARLLSLAMLIQAAELFFLSRQISFQTVWNYKNLQIDLLNGIPLKPKWTQILFSDQLFQKITVLQMVIAALSLAYPQFAFFVLLFFTHLTICIRFRGNFNGGSDMMTFVVLTGILIAFTGWPKLGLIYITIHTLYSYFKAGLTKARFKEWWTGSSLPIFLKRSQFLDMHQLAEWLDSKQILKNLLGTGVLLFELASFTLLFFPNIAFTYFAVAIFFHATIYFIFGLNRFFWIWISAWPATLYSLSLLATNY